MNIKIRSIFNETTFKYLMKISLIKIPYWITMILLPLCIMANINHAFNLNGYNSTYTILNTITPLIALIYLLLRIKRKRELIKKHNEKIHTIFSKN